MKRNWIPASILSFVLLAATAHADALPPQTQTTINGPEASKIANLVIIGGDQYGTYAQGKLEVSCVKKQDEQNFTCVIKVAEQ